MKKIDQEQQAVFTTGVFLLVTADDEVTCRRRSRRVQQTLAAAGMRARLLTHLQEQGLMAAGPWDMFPEELRPKDRSLFQISSETLAAAFPFSSGGVNHRDGVVLGSDSDGGIVIVNRWDLTPGSPAVLQGVTNRNFAILSPPGGGKSHTVKCTTLREWAMGAKVIIIDPEREYRSMVKKVGGAWLNAAGGGTRINPFQAPSLPPDTDDDDGEAMANQTTILIHAQRVQDFLSTYLPGLTPLQTALLDQGVEETYSKNGIGFDDDPASIPPEKWPHMGTLYQICQKHSDEEPQSEWTTLAALLKSAGDGMLSHLWAGPSTVPDVAGANFVCLDIYDLLNAAPNVRRAQFLNILGYAWDLVRADRKEKVILVVDEAWMLIDPQSPEALKFMKSLSKRIRKYTGSMMVVTQNVVDFLNERIRGDGEQVLTNSAFTFLMRQGGRDLQELTKLFDLSQAEQDRLSNAPQGEGLLIAGNRRVWLKVETAPYETAMMYGS
jgi:type IV secretory pathway VirB4 component